jgi:hypothetical protein
MIPARDTLPLVPPAATGDLKQPNRAGKDVAPGRGTEDAVALRPPPAEPALREVEALDETADPAMRDRGRTGMEARPDGQIPPSVPSATGESRSSGPAAPASPAPELAPGMPPVSGAEDMILPVGDMREVPRAAEPAGAAATPTASAEAGRNVALQIVTAVRTDGDGGFELQLSPEELGKVRLALHVSEGTVALSIHAERPETLDLMRRHIDILEREFHDAGFTSMSFTFGQGSADGRRSAPPAYADAVRDWSSDPAPAADRSRASRPAGPTSHLDLRL